MTDKTRDLLVIKLATSTSITAESVSRHMGAIEATPVEFNDENLQKISDVDRILKTYKIARMASNPSDGGKVVNERRHGPEILQGRNSIEVAILGMIALRGAS